MTNDIYGDFDSAKVEYDKPGLPVGIHKVMITKEERKSTKAGDNEFLEVTFQAVEGEYKGKTTIGRYNLWNSNPKAANIAKQQLKKIGDSSGKPVSAENPLKGRVLCIEVRQQEDNSDYTEISKYYPEDYTS